MTEFEGLYTAIIKGNPKDVINSIRDIPTIHRQEILDTALEQAITLTTTPQIPNIKILLKLGANPDGPTDSEGTALNYAYASGNQQIVAMLLEAGANPDATNSTVLESAVQKGDLKHVIKFIEAGANPNDSTKLLFNDDLLAVAEDYPEVKEYLQKKFERTEEEPVKDSDLEEIQVDLPRPKMQNPGWIELYGPYGDDGYLTLNYCQPGLIYLDKHYWDSVERYLMYKMYQGSYKGKAIKEAPSLHEARKMFKVLTVPVAKTPRQLVVNQRLRPLAESKPNTHYLQHREQLFFIVNKAKFTQQELYRNKLLATGDIPIFNCDAHDSFGYEGNLLGNTLMNIRHQLGGAKYDSRDLPKTNNLTIKRYLGNPNFYVIRGDPEPELATEIRKLGTFRNSSGKIVRGKLNLNLYGGSGWLIPAEHYPDAKWLVFQTFPSQKQIESYGRGWVKRRSMLIVEVAILFAKFRDRSEVGADDILFVIKDIFGAESFAGEEQPNESFMRSVWKFTDFQESAITDTAIQILWNYLSIIVSQILDGVRDFPELQERLDGADSDIFDKAINSLEGLTERESILVVSFKRIFGLLQKISDNESKACTTAIYMMFGRDYYDQIRMIYSKRAQTSVIRSTYSSEEHQFRDRFGIQNMHIKDIINHLPDLSKKCKLLFLIATDYILSMEDAEAVQLSRRLLLLSQNGLKPPTPIPEQFPEQQPEQAVFEQQPEQAVFEQLPEQQSQALPSLEIQDIE